MTSDLDARIYFTHSYAYRERGLNEHTNGLDPAILSASKRLWLNSIIVWGKHWTPMRLHQHQDCVNRCPSKWNLHFNYYVVKSINKQNMTDHWGGF
jgi:IS30 family transposase